MRAQPELPATHSPAWVVQSWVSFATSVLATTLGIYCLPDGGWVKGFLAMGLLFTVGSSLSLAKTVRDLRALRGVAYVLGAAESPPACWLADHAPTRHAPEAFVNPHLRGGLPPEFCTPPSSVAV